MQENTERLAALQVRSYPLTGWTLTACCRPRWRSWRGRWWGSARRPGRTAGSWRRRSRWVAAVSLYFWAVTNRPELDCKMWWKPDKVTYTVYKVVNGYTT